MVSGRDQLELVTEEDEEEEGEPQRHQPRGNVVTYGLHGVVLGLVEHGFQRDLRLGRYARPRASCNP